MYRSVEVRWFFRSKPFPANIFFPDTSPAQTRTDWYAFPCDERSGVKIREGNYEVKLRTRNPGKLAPAGQSGPLGVIGQLEEWRKWSVSFPYGDLPSDEVLTGAGWVSTTKTRRMRLFSIPGGAARIGDVTEEAAGRIDNGCQVEYTEVTAKEQKWWTIGLEAFGRPELLEENIRTAAGHFFSVLLRSLGDELSGFELSNSYGYPAWLEVLASQ